ncbi:hypothetical protein [Bifidobacterium sp.]
MDPVKLHNIAKKLEQSNRGTRHRLEVYTYTWAGLPRLRRGDRIRLDQCSARTMTSVFNGHVWKQQRDGGTPFSYRGVPCCVIFSDLVENRYSVDAVCMGQFCAKLPDLVAEVYTYGPFD